MVHWPLMDGLLHFIQGGGPWAGCGPAQYPPRCTKYNNPPLNGQCTNHCIALNAEHFSWSLLLVSYIFQLQGPVICTARRTTYRQPGDRLEST